MPLPKCEEYGMHVPQAALNGGHRSTAYCREGANRVRQRAALDDARSVKEYVFLADSAALDSVLTFRYLGWPLWAFEDDWPAIYHNLAKARVRWARFSRLLAREGADARMSGIFYKAVVQAVLLYGCETWVVTPAVLAALEGFHHRVARRLSGRQPRYLPGRDEWVFPPIVKPSKRLACIRSDIISVSGRIRWQTT